MTLPYDPSTIRIKTPDKWTLMGTMQKNRDMGLKVTGQAVFGSDIRLPGMLYAAVKACPVWGGDVKSYNFDAIKNRPGVHSAVRVPRNGPSAMSGGVAVVADSWWRAQTALDAMPIEWDYGAGVNNTSESLLADHMATFKQPGNTITNVGNVDAAFQGRRRSSRQSIGSRIVPRPASSRAPQRCSSPTTVWTAGSEPRPRRTCCRRRQK